MPAIDGMSSVPALNAMYPESLIKLNDAIFEKFAAPLDAVKIRQFAEQWVAAPRDRVELTGKKNTPSTPATDTQITPLFIHGPFQPRPFQHNFETLDLEIAVALKFEKIDCWDVSPQRVKEAKRGEKSRVQANREKAFMSRVFRWGYERGKVKMNPCQGVRQFKEKARTRLITDNEYAALYHVSPTLVRAAMEIAYLCCARQSDVLELKKSNLIDEGILIQQHKTGVIQVKAWTKRLSAAVQLAGELPINPGMSSLYVLHQKSGSRFTRDSFNAHWAKAKKLAAERYPELSFDFTFHDLKAKGISDLDGNLYEKQSISGHKNVTQTARYDRKVKVVPVVGGQNMVKPNGENMVKGKR